MITDWNPLDPDGIRVVYDLRDWTFDQQAELASTLAEQELPHAWDGTDLVVPPQAEQVVDAIIADLEVALGVVYSGDGSAAPNALGIELSPVATLTEYELDEWSPELRTSLSARLTLEELAHRWEGSTLVVHADEEAAVESVMDDVEAGRDAASSIDDGRLLEEMFLAVQRLQRDILDADALESLAALEASIDPVRPPFGVDPVLWHRAIDLFDSLVDALTDEDGADGVTAIQSAEQLFTLLRAHV